MRESAQKRAKPTARVAKPDHGAPPSQLVLRQFRVLFNTMKSHFAQVERLAGVGGAQLWALSVVAQSPGCTLGDLARAMDIHQTTASNLVRTLSERALISVKADTLDKRTRRLHVRVAGRRILQAAPGPFAGVLPDALASLDAATLARLHRDLARLIARVRAEPGAAHIPLGQK
jgi:DNA-binding MarR family transcriptional regulator